jgi:hypothetical protein
MKQHIFQKPLQGGSQKLGRRNGRQGRCDNGPSGGNQLQSQEHAAAAYKAGPQFGLKQTRIADSGPSPSQGRMTNNLHMPSSPWHWYQRYHDLIIVLLTSRVVPLAYSKPSPRPPSPRPTALQHRPRRAFPGFLRCPRVFCDGHR